MTHALVWAATPKALVKQTPWGWRSGCVCGWEQECAALGTKKEARRAYYRHRGSVVR